MGESSIKLSEGRITLRFDGGSRGNPGPAAIGISLETDDGISVVSLGRNIGRATSNVAEYTALLTGLREAGKLGVKHLRVLGDSELVIKQLLGEYKVRNEVLKPLYLQAVTLLRGFQRTEIGHNRRGHNTLADALANLAMDRGRDVTDADLPSGGVDTGSGYLPDSDFGGSETVDQPRERYACPNCGCEIAIEQPGQVPLVPGMFVCRCGTDMSRLR